VDSPALAEAGARLLALKGRRLGCAVAGHRVEFIDWGFYRPAPWRNYPHSHSYFELCLGYAGRGLFRSRGEEFPVGAGELFVARPGDVHEILADGQDPLGIVFWAFTSVRTAGDAAGDSSGGPGSNLLEAFAASNRRVAPAGPDLARVLAGIAAEAAAPGPGGDELLTALGAALVIGAARAVLPELTVRQDIGAGGRSAEQAVVDTMLRYLHDNLDRPVPVRDVAAQVHLSDRHAARLFRRTTGLPVHTYLTRHRLERAAQLLTEPGASVRAVALACGYPDARHFAAAFRRHWSVTPSAIRDGAGTRHLTPEPAPAAQLRL
jgi:AraC family L-rhamnose operon transcriptional activator RhaR